MHFVAPKQVANEPGHPGRRLAFHAATSPALPPAGTHSFIGCPEAIWPLPFPSRGRTGGRSSVITTWVAPSCLARAALRSNASRAASARHKGVAARHARTAKWWVLIGSQPDHSIRRPIPAGGYRAADFSGSRQWSPASRGAAPTSSRAPRQYAGASPEYV